MEERSDVPERPHITTTRSGVHQVSPSEILKSEAGRRVIRETIRSTVYRNIDLKSRGGKQT